MGNLKLYFSHSNLTRSMADETHHSPKKDKCEVSKETDC